MSLSFCSLNTGSNANSFYIGNSQNAVLIDCGLRCRETERRLNNLSLSLVNISAIFISHEHSDHIAGLQTIAKKHQIPVYISQATLQKLRFSLPTHLVNLISDGDIISVGSLKISAFKKLHDAVDPHSFTVSNDEVTVGIFTDIGDCCTTLKHHFEQCHAVFLEANYDTDMLFTGNYPYPLKKRISGGMGHLSNDKALELFLQHRTQKLSHLLLAHLSQHNNNPSLVKQMFDQVAENVKIAVASRHEASELYSIG
jgi:phosphoribosyl 1,2-cyclic phosphodiesterase